MILIFDLGTQSFRATVLDRTGERQFEWSCPIESTSRDSIAEQNPLDWKNALFNAIEALKQNNQLTSQIRLITASATLSGLVCLDDEGQPLRSAIMYADRRPASQLPAIESHSEFQKSGWRAYSGDFLPQLCYLRNEEPHIYSRSRWLLDSTGYLNYLLTGQTTLDRYTTYTCYADAAKRDLPAQLMEHLKIDKSKLGRIVDAGESLGVAHNFESVPVISVSYDSAAAYLGSQLQHPGDALDISGTVTSFGVLTNTRMVDPARRVFSIPYGNQWLVRGSTAMSGGVLEWARQTLFDGGFDQFDQAVSASPPGANGVTFLPYLAGARAPLWEPSACGVFHGLSAQTTRADMARAVYEGLCFSLDDIIATIESCGVPVTSIRLGGGLSRNALLNQMKADITGKTVLPLVDQEVTTLGSATVAARTLGWLKAGESFSKAGAAIEPQQSVALEYQEAFTRYRKLTATLWGS